MCHTFVVINILHSIRSVGALVALILPISFVSMNCLHMFFVNIFCKSFVTFFTTKGGMFEINMASKGPSINDYTIFQGEGGTQGLIQTLGSMVIFDENQGVSDLSKYVKIIKFLVI